MTEQAPAALIEATNREKRNKLLDLLRRATANGTSEEVADAIAQDWFPLCQIGANGKIEFLIGAAPQGRRDGEKMENPHA